MSEKRPSRPICEICDHELDNQYTEVSCGEIQAQSFTCGHCGIYSVGFNPSTNFVEVRNQNGGRIRNYWDRLKTRPPRVEKLILEVRRENLHMLKGWP